MVYSGTHIAAGRGRAVVVATALDREVGKIASRNPRTAIALGVVVLLTDDGAAYGTRTLDSSQPIPSLSDWISRSSTSMSMGFVR